MTSPFVRTMAAVWDDFSVPYDEMPGFTTLSRKALKTRFPGVACLFGPIDSLDGAPVDGVKCSHVRVGSNQGFSHRERDDSYDVGAFTYIIEINGPAPSLRNISLSVDSTVDSSASSGATIYTSLEGMKIRDYHLI